MANSQVIFGKLIREGETANLFEGLYKPTKQKIMIKQYPFRDISHLAQSLKELFCQAKLHHARFCSLTDVFFNENEAGYELLLCLERLERDLEKEIKDRAGRNEEYTEQELWEFLQGTVEALALAQDLVAST